MTKLVHFSNKKILPLRNVQISTKHFVNESECFIRTSERRSSVTKCEQLAFLPISLDYNDNNIITANKVGFIRLDRAHLTSS